MRSIAQFLLIGLLVGVITPFFISLCLFGTTLQTFVAAPQPTTGYYWSGAPTPVPTRVPSPVRVWTGTAFSSAGGAVFLLWSILGACIGEAAALRWLRVDWDKVRKAGVGAIAGSLIFIGITLCGLLR
jgi:hypothetical protein